MSIETLVQNLITALEANTAALQAAGGAAPAAAATTAAKGGKGKAGAAAKTVPTEAEVNAALSELKDYIDGKGEKGITYARKVLSKVADVQKMAEVPEDKRAEVIKEAAKELEAYKAAEEQDEDM